MTINKAIKSEIKDIKGIFGRFKRRDFSGDGGLIVKNSFWQMSTNIVAKVGSLFFTMILARILMPELFGLYSLALSTIIFFTTFTDLGIDSGIVLFISKNFYKNKDSTRKYFTYFLKIKVILLILTAFILGILAKPISENFYHKPIFLALIAGSFYIIIRGLVSFSKSLFNGINNFKYPFVAELIFQILRLIFIPLILILIIEEIVKNPSNIYIIIAGLALLWLIVLLVHIRLLKTKTSLLYKSKNSLTAKERTKIRKVIFPLSTIALSGIFFGYVDIAVLGRFVSSESIGLYQAAFSLIGAMIAVVGFSSVLLPIFGKLSNKRKKYMLNKSVRVFVLIGIFGAFITYLLSDYIILLAFGREYLAAATFLKIFSLLIIIAPIESIYASYLISKEQTKKVAIILIGVTIINILLNITAAISFRSLGEFSVVVGICFATLLSKLIYLVAVIIASRPKN
jgi:stage V sporulation protein B